MSLSPGPPVWGSGTPSAESEAAEDVARRIARNASIAFALLLGLSLLDEVPQISDAPSWWRVGSVMLALATMGLLVSRRAPREVIRVIWAGYPVFWALVSIAWPLFVAATHRGPSLIPWSWILAPLAISIAALRWGLPAATAIGVAPVLTVLLTALLTGGLTPDIASTVALHLGNPLFAVLVVAARGQLFETWRIGRQLADEEQAAILQQAWRDELDRLTAIVHDQVLSTLGAAGACADPADLATAARHSAALLAERPGPVGSSATLLRGKLHALALANGFEFSLDESPQEILFPAEVVEAVVAAVAQAAHNSAEHAGEGASPVSRTLHTRLGPGWVEVEVADDGVGFDPAAVPESRLGLRSSVLRRMDLLDGGSATVDSAPGSGTRVVVSWHADRVVSKGQQPLPAPRAVELPDLGTVTGVTSLPSRLILLFCWALGLVWMALVWPELALPGLVVFAASWLLVAIVVVTRPVPELPAAQAVLVAFVPAACVGCLLLQRPMVHPQQVWLSLLASDLDALLALRGHVRSAVYGIVLMVLVGMSLTWRMGQLLEAPSLLVGPVIGVVAGVMLFRGLSRTMQANVDVRDAEAGAGAAAQAACEAAERADGLRAEVARLGEPCLDALVAGADVNTRTAQDCLMAAAAIRDLLRAPALATGSLGRACGEARKRGVQIRLFDDSPGLQPLEDDILQELALAVDSAVGGRVIIRRQPPGRRTAVTAVLDDDEVRRLEFA